MAMKAVVTDAELGALPDTHKAEYKKGADGLHYLDVTAYESPTGAKYALEDVSGLRSVVAKERARAETAETTLKGFEGIDPAKARDALTKVGEMSNWTPEQKVEERIATVKKEVEAKLTAEKAKVEARLNETTAFLQQSMITEAATRAIAAAKGSATLLLPHVQRITRLRELAGGKGFVVEVLGPDGNPRISPKPGSTAPMAIEELVDEMSKSTDFARAFDASGASGSGASGTTTGTAGGSNRTDSAPRGAKTIRADDSAGLSANLEAVASGEVTIIA